MDILRFYAHRLYSSFRGEFLVLPSKMILLVLVISFLCLPLITQNPYYLRIFIFANIFCIYAASWDLLAGFAGQLSLGHGAFFGIGAYAAALLNVSQGLPPWVSIPIGAVIAALAGLVLGLPALRLKGLYLALVTLTFPIILEGLVYAFPGFTGGEMGLSSVEALSTSPLINYYVSLLLMVCLGLAMWKFCDSNTGLLFHALREDEVAARASGINTTKYKLLAFCLSAFFAGISGGLYAHTLRIAGPSMFSLMTTFQPVIWTIFGGIGTIYGPIIGVYMLYPLMQIPAIIEFKTIIFALLIIVFLLFMPQGVATKMRDIIEKECPRCKVRNMATRKYCRVCEAAL